MDKQQQRKELIPHIILAAVIAAIFIFSICVYLNSPDCYGLMGEEQKCITGWDTLKLEWPSFWAWVTACSIIGVACIIISIFNETGAGKFGKALKGNSTTTIILLICALLLLTTPWGRACTDKSNAGITAPGYKTTVK